MKSFIFIVDLYESLVLNVTVILLSNDIFLCFVQKYGFDLKSYHKRET